MNLHKHLLAAGLVASLGLSAAFAQTPPPGRQHDPARMEQHIAKMKERRAQKLADLKAKLQITAAQETSWNAWVAAMHGTISGVQRKATGQTPTSSMAAASATGATCWPGACSTISRASHGTCGTGGVTPTR